MYSLFCHHIQQEEQKHRATMHIPRRLAETVEVDWAGDPAHIIDPNIRGFMKVYLFVATLLYSQYTVQLPHRAGWHVLLRSLSV